MKQFFVGVMLGFLLTGNIIAADASGSFAATNSAPVNFP